MQLLDLLKVNVEDSAGSVPPRTISMEKERGKAGNIPLSKSAAVDSSSERLRLPSSHRGHTALRS